MATVGAVVGRFVAAASRPTTARPLPTLKIAASKGIAAATIDANMIRSSSRAQVRPMISESRSFGACPIWPAPPPYSTVSPACRAGCTAVSNVDRYAESSDAGTTSQETPP